MNKKDWEEIINLNWIKSLDKELISEPLNNLFDDLDKETSKDSVKDSNNTIKSIILIYENNKFEQIDKIRD